jgi:hypothetical protein
MGLEGRIGVSSCLLTHASRAAWRTSVVKVAGVIVGRAGRMSGAGPKRARGGQANHPRGSHQLENVTPSESALIHIRLLSNDLVAATIADPGKDRSSTHYDPSLEVRIGSRLCENSNAELARRNIVSIAFNRKRTLLAITVEWGQDRKQFCALSARARFHTAWVKNGSVRRGFAPRIANRESSRQTGLPPDEEGRTDDFQNCEPNEW